MYTLNINTAVLYENCSYDGIISSLLGFLFVDSKRSGKISFTACP